jgi:carboxymethylenebutenolidase
MSNPDQSRREFVGLSAAVGLAAATGSIAAAPLEVSEQEVAIKTADGNCDAAFYHPKRGAHAGVLIWTDIFGLRPAFRDFGRRLAAAGYAVLVPNPFYRTAKAPVFGDITGFNFQNEADRAKLPPLVGPLNAAGAAESDARAYLAFLDAQRQVSRSKKIGTQGYCMGGPLIMKTAAAVPERVGAAASFHGGGLVTDKSDSPHLLIPKIKAQLYFAIAANDDARQPEAKDTLRSACAAANVKAEIEVYAGAQHGWCVPDMPAQNGMAIYSKADAERAWGKLLALYRTALA